MKKANCLSIGVLFFVLNIATAQASKHTDDIPLVDPVTNCSVRYYYYPNLEAYFDTKKSVFLYSEKGKWITADELPNGYRGYSLYNKVNVFITDYDDDDVTQFIKVHRKKYPYIHNRKTNNATVSLE